MFVGGQSSAEGARFEAPRRVGCVGSPFNWGEGAWPPWPRFWLRLLLNQTVIAALKTAVTLQSVNRSNSGFTCVHIIIDEQFVHLNSHMSIDQHRQLTNSLTCKWIWMLKKKNILTLYCNRSADYFSIHRTGIWGIETQAMCIALYESQSIQTSY